MSFDYEKYRIMAPERPKYPAKPSRDDYETESDYYRALADYLDSDQEEKRRKAIDEYYQKVSEYNTFLKDKMIESANFYNFPSAVMEILYSRAYNERHSESYNAVYEELEELVDLVKNIQEAFNQEG